MISVTEFNLFAHIATVDDDYEWYEVLDGSCRKCCTNGITSRPQPFQTELDRYPCDQQPLLLLTRRTEESASLPWMVTLGPMGTPWCDRYFGRPIRIRLAIECSDSATAFGFFAWGLLQWWEQRHQLPPADPNLAIIPSEQQPSAVANWILDVPLRQMFASEWMHEPWLNTVSEPLVHRRLPVTRRYSNDARDHLLNWLGCNMTPKPKRLQPFDGSFENGLGSQCIAAVSQGIMPQYHHQTLWSLGMESIYPDRWQELVTSEESFAPEPWQRKRSENRRTKYPTCDVNTLVRVCQACVHETLVLLRRAVRRTPRPDTYATSDSARDTRKTQRRPS